MSGSKSIAQTDDQLTVLKTAKQYPDESPAELANRIDDPHIKQEYVSSILQSFRLPDDADIDVSDGEQADTDTESTADAMTDPDTTADDATNTTSDGTNDTASSSSDESEGATETDDDSAPELSGVRRNEAQYALEKLGERTKKQRGYIVVYVLRGRHDDSAKTWLSEVAGASQASTSASNRITRS